MRERRSRFSLAKERLTPEMKSSPSRSAWRHLLSRHYSERPWFPTIVLIQPAASDFSVRKVRRRRWRNVSRCLLPPLLFRTLSTVPLLVKREPCKLISIHPALVFG